MRPNLRLHFSYSLLLSGEVATRGPVNRMAAGRRLAASINAHSREWMLFVQVTCPARTSGKSQSLRSRPPAAWNNFSPSTVGFTSCTLSTCAPAAAMASETPSVPAVRSAD